MKKRYKTSRAGLALATQATDKAGIVSSPPLVLPCTMPRAHQARSLRAASILRPVLSRAGHGEVGGFLGGKIALSASRQDVSLQHIQWKVPRHIVVPASENGNHLEFRNDENELPASAFRAVRRDVTTTH